MFGSDQLSVIGWWITAIAVISIILFTLWVKWDEWFGTKKTVPATATSPTTVAVVATASPAPPAPAPTPAPTPAPALRPATPRGSSPTVTVFKYAFGLLLILAVFAGLVYGISRLWVPSEQPSRSVGKPSPAFPRRAEIQVFAYEFWNRKIPLFDAWKMLRVIELESGFHQFNEDGTIFLGIDDKDDIGTHQINRRVNADRIRKLGFDPYTMQGDQKYNIYLPEGNFNVALAFYNERGFKDWQRTVDRIKEDVVYPYIAPVNEWSEVHKMGANCNWFPDRPMKLMDDKGVKHDLIPGKILVIRSWTFQISVPDEPQGKMDYICSQI